MYQKSFTTNPQKGTSQSAATGVSKSPFRGLEVKCLLICLLTKNENLKNEESKCVDALWFDFIISAC